MNPLLLGLLGGGQLGRMLALAGYPLGVISRCLEPASESSAALVCERLAGEYEDYQALFKFAQNLTAITYEFENVPVATAEWLNDRVPVFPPPRALQVAQDRIAEKSFFRDLGVPVPPFRAVDSREQLNAALSEIGLPAVLKTTRFGYDGKGQAVLKTPHDVEEAWERLKGRSLILEGFVDFERELSILGVRSRSGECVFYPLMQNHHREGMLRLTLAPAPRLTRQLQNRAEEIARLALEALNYVGVLAIELFEKNGELSVNEMAPRVHNSGHWTIEGSETSQFENHLRAVLNLPLGSPSTRGFSAMLNLIGDVPDWAQTLRQRNLHLHWYGKTPKPNRKLGHLTLRCDTEAERDQILSAL
jgi:5-(carboxyamino)imidazole ribonucleotide synthase